jgi:hypothetical protein
MYRYGFLLFCIAVLLFVILAPIGFFYSLLIFICSSSFKAVGRKINKYFRKVGRKINKYFRKIAYIIDVAGSVIMEELFNKLLIKEGGFSFIGRALNMIEKQHIEKAAKLEGLV